MGPCIGGLYYGAFAHADDIRTISTSRDTLHEQISVVESSSSREIKKEFIDLDFSLLLEESKTHFSTTVAAEIAESTSWLKIWDLALDYGPHGTSAIQALFSTMTKPMCGSPPCGFCEDLVTATYLDHFLLCHLPTNCPGMSKEDIIEELKKETLTLTTSSGYSH